MAGQTVASLVPFLSASIPLSLTHSLYSHAQTRPHARLEDDNVSAVISLVVCHPTLNVLAGSNASGKVYLWR